MTPRPPRADPSDPKIEGSPEPATVWYRWTAPADGWYQFDTHGSQVSSGLGVYTDTSPAQLVDDSASECNGLSFLGVSSAAVKFQATASSSYLLMVGGTNAFDPTAASLGGPLQLNWRSSASAPVAADTDAFAAASPISGAFGMASGNTDGATAEPAEPGIDGQAAHNSVWFSWTPPATGTYLLSSSRASPTGAQRRWRSIPGTRWQRGSSFPTPTRGCRRWLPRVARRLG